MTESLAELEQRLANGERYLAANPDDEQARALYFTLMDRLTDLWLDENGYRTVVTLALPEGVRYSRTTDSPEQSTVAVVMHGTVGEGEMGIGDLDAMNETIAMAEEARHE